MKDIFSRAFIAAAVANLNLVAAKQPYWAFNTNSSNWAGVVLNPPDGEHFTSVSSDFIIPEARAPADGFYYTSMWVGIDGENDRVRKPAVSMLQAGFCITANQTNGSPSPNYFPDAFIFAQWLPAPANHFFNDSFAVSPGDHVAINVTALTNVNGTAIFENLTTGKSLTRYLNAPTLDHAVIGHKAEWIVEPPGYFEDGVKKQDVLTDFDNVTFKNAVAKTDRPRQMKAGSRKAAITKIVDLIEYKDKREPLRSLLGWKLTAVDMPHRDEIRIKSVEKGDGPAT